MGKTAVVTGGSGQAAYWLIQLLHDKGYEIHTLVRRNSQNSLGNIKLLPQKVRDNLTVHKVDILDDQGVREVVKMAKPDELYHLAAMSFVGASWANSKVTFETNTIGTLNVLSAVRDQYPACKIFHASSSEMFGKVVETPQSESTPFHPRSPYGVSKVAAHWMVKNYRESYGLFAANGIMFNYSSITRGEEFVSMKIAKAVAAISCGKQECLYLGNLSARRDFSFAGDTMNGAYLIMQQNEPDDFVLSSGETHSIREFCELAFGATGATIKWRGTGLDEVGFNSDMGKVLVKVDPQFFRPAEVDLLIGNSAKARSILGWKPVKSYPDLVRGMVENEIRKLKATKTDN